MPDIDIKFTDRSGETMAAFRAACARGLIAVGIAAEGYAKAITPVDTGRLRNSISHAATEDAAYIGTNVEYAPYVEFGTSRNKAHHMLKRAASEHSEEYRQILEDSLKNA